MANQNCFVVMYITGECDDQTRVPCAVFMNENTARYYIEDRNSLLESLGLYMDSPRGCTFPEQYESRWDYAEAMTREHGFPRSPDYNGAMYFLYSSSGVEFHQ